MELEKVKNRVIIIALVLFTFFLSGFSSMSNVNAYSIESDGQSYKYENYITQSYASRRNGRIIVIHFYYNGNFEDYLSSSIKYTNSTSYNWSLVNPMDLSKVMLWREEYDPNMNLITSVPDFSYFMVNTNMSDEPSKFENVKASDQRIIDSINNFTKGTITVPKLTPPRDPLFRPEWGEKMTTDFLRDSSVVLPIGLAIFLVGVLIYCWRRWLHSLI